MASSGLSALSGAEFRICWKELIILWEHNGPFDAGCLCSFWALQINLYASLSQFCISDDEPMGGILIRSWLLLRYIITRLNQTQSLIAASKKDIGKNWRHNCNVQLVNYMERLTPIFFILNPVLASKIWVQNGYSIQKVTMLEVNSLFSANYTQNVIANIW